MNNYEMKSREAVGFVNTVWGAQEGYNMHPKTHDRWQEAKSEYLSDLFGGELILSKEVVVEQSYNDMYRDICSFESNLKSLIRREAWYKESETKGRSVWYELTSLITARNLYDNKADDNYSLGDKIKFSKGEKLTRGFKKLLSNPEDVNRMQVEYSQLMNTKKLTGILCLSIHPMDFLTMSYTGTWSSCYNVFNEGECRAGALEYMCSKNTICAYLYTKDMDLPGVDSRWNDKKWRSIISIDPDKYILTGKNYPYQSEELTGMAYEWVRSLLANKDSFPEYKETDILDDTNHYAEINYGYDDAEYAGEFFHIGTSTEFTGTVAIEYGSVPCPKCGGEHHIYHECVVCERCDDSFYCDCCEERHRGDTYEVTNHWGESSYVCYSCFDYHYRTCESCGESHYEDDMTYIDGNDYCNDCRDDKFTYCEDCNEYYETTVEYNGDTLCEDCYAIRKAEDEEEEKEEA